MKKLLTESFLGVCVIEETTPGIIEALDPQLKDPFRTGQPIQDTARIWILYYSDGSLVMKLQLYGEEPRYCNVENCLDDNENYVVSFDDFRSAP